VGSSAVQAEVLLAEEDVQHLQDKQYDFSVGRDTAGFVCVIIRGLKLASIYKQRVADLLVRLPPGFPMARPDMFWTEPHIQLATGAFPVCANTFDVNYDGRQWQRWSRHLDASQWRPGRDNLQTFLGIIRRELQEEI